MPAENKKVGVLWFAKYTLECWVLILKDEELLSGKDAVFAVELKGLSKRELPELNDEFAEDVSEFSTL